MHCPRPSHPVVLVTGEGVSELAVWLTGRKRWSLSTSSVTFPQTALSGLPLDSKALGSPASRPIDWTADLGWWGLRPAELPYPLVPSHVGLSVPVGGRACGFSFPRLELFHFLFFFFFQLVPRPSVSVTRVFSLGQGAGGLRARVCLIN